MKLMHTVREFRTASKVAPGSQDLMVAGRRLKPSFERAKALFVACALILSGATLEASTVDNNESGSVDSQRDLAALAFPRARVSDDTDDVLKNYTPFLRFVLVIGNDVDRQTAKRLEQTYEILRKRNPAGAARFLKGLRFEMVHKLEFMGMSQASVTTSTPDVRRWVFRYMKEWLRECDEHLFRSLVVRK